MESAAASQIAGPQTLIRSIDTRQLTILPYHVRSTHQFPGNSRSGHFFPGNGKNFRDPGNSGPVNIPSRNSTRK